MTAVALSANPGTEVRPASHRYGVVLLVTFVLLVFSIVVPHSSWARAVAIGLQGTALVVVVATSRSRPATRRLRVLAAGGAGAALVLGIGTGVLSPAASFAASGVLTTSITIALVVGSVRLVRDRSVTLEVVAAGLTIYLLLGLIFAWIVGFVAAVEGARYFAGHAYVAPTSIVYYSFTVLTTTGFGDLTAATRLGRALAVVEMLVGQLYLVTVIGVLVGGFAGRSRPGTTRAGS